MPPPVPELRLLGTTWYRRGLAYWVRRVLLAFVYTLILLFVTWLVGIVYDVIVEQATGVWRIIVLVIASLIVCWSLYSGLRQLVSEHRQMTGRGDIGKQQPRTGGRSATTVGLGAGVAGYGGSTLAGGLIIFGQLFVIGWALYAWLTAFRKYLTPQEAEAVRVVDEWRRQHGR